jgi:hypothetical protein
VEQEGFSLKAGTVIVGCHNVALQIGDDLEGSNGVKALFACLPETGNWFTDFLRQPFLKPTVLIAKRRHPSTGIAPPGRAGLV